MLLCIGCLISLCSALSYGRGTRSALRSSSLYFAENKGQITDQFGAPRTDIDFKCAASTQLTVFLSAGHISYQWAIADTQHLSTSLTDSTTTPTTYAMYRMEVTCINANPHATVTTSDALLHTERYLQPWVNTNNHHTGVLVNHYKKITYHNIYPNIDWVWYINASGQLEHDFIVKPGGNPQHIQLAYTGHSKAAIQDNGSFKAQNTVGSITEKAPIAWTDEHKPIPIAFHYQHNNLSYTIAPYQGTLTIDPTIEWATYFGGVGNEETKGVAHDQEGNIYFTGNTNSTSNIATTGAYQTQYNGGNNDVYLAKFNTSGALIWATYYGGPNDELSRSIIIDTLGHLYIAGSTTSTTGISTTGAYQTTKSSAEDAFIAKLDTMGNLVWGTYFGGTNTDAKNTAKLSLDNTNNIYLLMNTQSNNLPTTANAHQLTLAGSTDCAITKWNAQGQLIWCTYFGGTASDDPNSMDIDSLNNIYIIGYTQSTTGIASAGAYQSIKSGGADAFVAKFNSDGQRQWSTYFGSTATDWGLTIALSNQALFCGGVTVSQTNIATSGAHQTNYGGGAQDGLIFSLSYDGNLNWATYYGGSNTEAISYLAVENNNLYVVGVTSSDTGIASTNAIQLQITGVYTDFLIAKFNSEGSRVWGTYYGSLDVETSGLITAQNNKVYIVGKSLSANGIATNNSYQNTIAGGYDAVLIKINDCDKPILTNNILGDTLVCAQTEQVYTLPMDTSNLHYQWILPASWQGYSDSNSINTLIADSSAFIQILGTNGCGASSDTLGLYITVLPIPNPQIQANGLLLYTTQAYAQYEWYKNNAPISGATQATYTALENGSYQVKVTNNDDCTGMSPTFIVNTIVGLKPNPDRAELTFYPNPVIDYITIVTLNPSQIRIYNAQGNRVIDKQTLQPGSNTISMQYLPAGTYWLQYTNAMQTSYYKITKL
jgi:hypothetical protein